MFHKYKYLQLISLSLLVLLGIKGKSLSAREVESLQFYGREIRGEELAGNQLAEAREFYEGGELQKAIALLKTAINQFELAGNGIGQTQALINLSLVYLKQGNWQETATNIGRAFELLNNIDSQPEKKILTNYALEIQGQLQLAIGQPETALTTWEKSGAIAYARGDVQRFLYAQIKQIQALQELGLYGKTQEILKNILTELETAPQDLIAARGWQSAGNLASKLGQLELAEIALERALNIAQRHQNSELISDIILSQGHLLFNQSRTPMGEAEDAIAQEERLLSNSRNLTRSQRRIIENDLAKNRQRLRGYVSETRKLYQQAASVSDNPSAGVSAQLAELNLLVSQNQEALTQLFISNLADKINGLPGAKSLIDRRINFALNLIELGQSQYGSLILEQLTRAYQESDQLNYQRGKSDALGNLAKLYQQSQRLSEAKELTERALYLAGQINAPDLAYQWQWQLGKLARQQNDRGGAISAYTQAVNTLESLRSELVGVNSDLEFNFRENVEPVYRELVDILLQPEPKEPQELTQKEIEELRLARDVVESLQVAELDNFFQDACLDVKEVNLDEVADRQTAVFYPIILPDRIEVIVSLPGESLRRYRAHINQETVENEIETLINNLYDLHKLQLINGSLHRLYNYLIQPIASELPSLGVRNLVFVADGFLKSVPMSALHDGKQYLVENYSVAIAPSLKLVEPQTLKKKEIRLLLAGLSQMNPENRRYGEFTNLPHVRQELNSLKEAIPDTTVLFNESFTQNQFEEEVGSSPVRVIHIATHGQFSSQLADTFLLTWDGEINIDELNRLFRQYARQRQPVELLVLSACQTAVGDKRAALGLAGIALRAGTQSTVASLWYVDDRSTELLMNNFYRQLLRGSHSKAEALRQAQLKVLGNPDFRHPYYWSAFILIGNWL